MSLRAPTRVSSDFLHCSGIVHHFSSPDTCALSLSTLKITGGCRCLLTWTTRKLARGRLFTGTEILCATALSAMGDFSAEHENIHMTKYPKPNCWRSTPTVPGVQNPEKNRKMLEVRRVAFQRFVGRTPTFLLSICVTQNQLRSPQRAHVAHADSQEVSGWTCLRVTSGFEGHMERARYFSELFATKLADMADELSSQWCNWPGPRFRKTNR